MIRILIVEDSDLYLTVEKKTFEDPILYEVMTVKSIKRAKESIQESEFDLILLDVNLEDGSGMEIVDFIRQERSDNKVYIVAISSEVNEELIIKLYRKGVDNYIKKPFSPAILKATVDRIGTRI